MKEEMRKEIIKGMKEFGIAWQEFFENKPEPENDEEELEEQKEFIHWYNYIRKQSDTRKTPAEMYKECYGEEPSEENFSEKFSRMMEFKEEEFGEDLLNSLARYCPECDEKGLMVTEDVNLYECEICSSIWRRLRPLNDGTGKMIDVPNKLKKLLKEK